MNLNRLGLFSSSPRIPNSPQVLMMTAMDASWNYESFSSGERGERLFFFSEVKTIHQKMMRTTNKTTGGILGTDPRQQQQQPENNKNRSKVYRKKGEEKRGPGLRGQGTVNVLGTVLADRQGKKKKGVWEGGCRGKYGKEIHPGKTTQQHLPPGFFPAPPKQGSSRTHVSWEDIHTPTLLFLYWHVYVVRNTSREINRKFLPPFYFCLDAHWSFCSSYRTKHKHKQEEQGQQEQTKTTSI